MQGRPFYSQLVRMPQYWKYLGYMLFLADEVGEEQVGEQGSSRYIQLNNFTDVLCLHFRKLHGTTKTCIVNKNINFKILIDPLGEFHNISGNTKIVSYAMASIPKSEIKVWQNESSPRSGRLIKIRLICLLANSRAMCFPIP